MKIKLPRNLEYLSTTEIPVYIENGVLYMPPNESFRRIMYSITYQMKVGNQCPYCGEEFDIWEFTIDHIYPRTYGGGSITNNLIPCCKECNEKKADLLLEQYERINKMKDENGKEEKKFNYRKQNLAKRSEFGIILPKEWYTIEKEYFVIGTLTSEFPVKSSKKYQDLHELYEIYGKICSPVVVSANQFVLDGFQALFLAKNIGEKVAIPFVKLDNVKVVI